MADDGGEVRASGVGGNEHPSGLGPRVERAKVVGRHEQRPQRQDTSIAEERERLTPLRGDRVEHPSESPQPIELAQRHLAVRIAWCG